MKSLDSLADALREGRAALLNPNLSEPERAAAVKVMEGALDLARIGSERTREALQLAEEALDIHVRATADAGDAHALALVRSVLS